MAPLVAILAFGVIALIEPAMAADATTTRSAAIKWLETHQNRNGSWGTGPTRAVTTAEGLLALARAGRASGTVAKRAAGWLLNQEFLGTDFEARAIRALEAAGVDMKIRAQALNASGTNGWGPSGGQGVDSYDSSLALSALDAAGVAPASLSVKLAEVLVRRRSDGGWSGDGVPVEVSVPESQSDRTISGEIVRALAPFYSDWNTPSSSRYISRKFISTDVANGGAAVTSSSDSLELAARLAGIHALGLTDAALQAQLLDDARLTGGVWSATDAFLNAMGLLALTTHPSQSFPPSCPNDADCDSFVDTIDAFPHDGTEHADLDSDGIGDVADRDRDGDGFCDQGEPTDTICTGIDRFSDDVTENIDNDNDGIGDNDEADSDGDGIPNLTELEKGTNPTDTDTDNDGSLDQFDPCPLVAYGSDADDDDVCAPLDECDNLQDPLARSALDIRNLDGDNLCDEADLDDDGDGFPDASEVVWGSDPRDDSSLPDNIAVTDPSGDFDQDGRTNLEEISPPFVLTNPYLADTDGDGALDGQELLGSPAYDPNSAASQPAAVLAVAASGAAEPVSGQFNNELASSGMRATTTLGQPTPVAAVDPPHVPSAGPNAVSLAGFQPQTFLGRDLDGDGLEGKEENQQRTSASRADTDGDRFVDGASGVVTKTRYADGRDLDGDGFVEGEGTIATDPTDAESRPGRPGDVAPLGFPDGQLRLADTLVETRLVSNPSLLDTLSGDSRDITLDAADWDEDGFVQSDDLLRTLKAVEAEDVLP